jgi:branched-chain amino acid transport system permease protein
MNIRATTLGVFTLSAAIAGLGGGVYGMGLQSAASNRFEFFGGVALLLTMVIGGVSSVGAAVFGGFFLGGPTLANLFPNLAQLTSMTVALAGIGLGSNPNGFIAQAVRPQWEPVKRTPKVLAGFLAALTAVWVIRLAGALDNWSWTLLTLALVLALPQVSARVRRLGVGPAPAADATSVPVEWLGLAGPWSDDDVAVLDRGLGLPKVLHGAP